MSVKHRRRYTAEFKSQILELLAAGRCARELAGEFEVGQDLIYSWRRKAEASGAPALGAQTSGTASDQEVMDELLKLRRQVADLQLDNDILKKAAVILGSEPQSKSAR